MSIKKLFQNNAQAITVSKYLKKTSASTLGDGIESRQHLSQSLQKRDRFIPAVNYENPAEFVQFGSAKRYYEDSFEYIRDYYPYDGSDMEVTKFQNELNPLENFIFNQYYPTSTGFVTVGQPYGTSTSDASGYFSSSNTQYIRTRGGPHSGTIYSESTYRTSNLEFGGPSGSTVEFFFRKNSGIPSSGQSEKQVIFDAWNNTLSSSHDYGRLRIELFSGSEDRFKVTMMSGTTGFFSQSVPTTGGLSDYLVSGSWHNYSFAFNTVDKVPYIDFYVDGVCVETNITASGHQAGLIGTVTGSLISNIGALRYAVSGTKDSSEATAMLGYGQLSASVDEFRFWKTARNAEKVGQYWFTEVYGGSNNHDANVALGVYYKFNEGITLTSSIDEVVLDYSGRISNGLYVGYDATTSRNTGSAINSLGLTSVREAGDPIIRGSNPLVVSQKEYFVNLGTQYDYTNSSYLMNMLPSWVYEEDENTSGELGNLNQILASYLDTLNLQISELAKIKNIRYTSGSLSGSNDEFTYNNRLLENSGLQLPEIFENIGVFGQLLERDQQINFDQELIHVKNSIYKNIYNNLNFIYKAKGNEKSIRNLIRCYGIDEDILDLSVYSNNEIYELNTRFDASVSNKKYLDFSGLRNQDSSAATIYQYYDGTTNAYGIITGSTELDPYGFTLEGEFVFPNKQNTKTLAYEPVHVLSSSLFGFHTPLSTEPTTVDTTWAPLGNTTYSDQGFQIYAVKSPAEYAEVTSPDYLVKDVYFEVRDSSDNILLTSDIYRNTYDGQKWNLALSLRNEKYPYADQIDGADSGVAAAKYTLSLYGANYDTGIKRNSFYKTTTLTYTSGSQTLVFPKKVYVGAHRTNFSGAILTYSDVKASSIRYWSQVLPTGTIDIHARDVDNYGHESPYQQAYSFQGTQTPQVYIPNIETLALNWDFANLGNPDSTGIITVTDFSSGSNLSGYPENYQGTVFSNVNKRQLGGRGEFFATGSSVVIKEYPYTEKQQLPEYVISRDMVDIKSTDIEVFRQNQKVNNYYFSIEKSPYKSISRRMLQFFASLDEMNNLIGEPVNQYRPNYKNMEKLREVFFRRVGNVPDFDKYAEYYKWVDYAMGQITAQLFPASSKYTLGTRTLIENHLLERPKYKWNYLGGIKKHKPDDPGETQRLRTGGKSDRCLEIPGWKFSHAPLGLDQANDCKWWKFRAQRSLPAFGVTDVGVIKTRTAILSASHSPVRDTRKLFKPAPGEVIFEDGISVLCLSADLRPVKVGGINQYLNKHRNLLTGTFDGFEPVEDCNDIIDPFAKTKVNFRGSLLLNKQVGAGRDYKGEEVMPFSAYSSSLSPDTSGYWNYLNNAGLVNIDLANFHEDTILPMGHSVPMQGPFTQTHVGGYQSRHVSPLKTFERKEKYKLEIASGTGSISILTTESLSPGLENSTPKGYYLRGLASKSPVNISNVLTTTGSAPVQARAIITIADSGGIANGETFTLTDTGGVTTVYTINGGVLPANGGGSGGTATVGFSGVGGGAAGKIAAAGAMVTAINNTTDASYTAASDGVDTVTITQGAAGAEGNRSTASTLSSTTVGSFSGGASATGRGGINVLGNFSKNYQVVQTVGRARNNMDFVFNTSNYDNGAQLEYTGTMASAFIIPPARRVGTGVPGNGAAGLSFPYSGSADYAAPRQITNRRTNQTIFVNRFAAPGSILDSKQQYRDVASDQFASNNALPFRNILVRKLGNLSYRNQGTGLGAGAGLHGYLRLYTGWGGFQQDASNEMDAVGGELSTLNSGNPYPIGVPRVYGSASISNIPSGSFVALHKTQRNTIKRLQISGTYDTITTFTASVRDNGFVNRPVPDADRTQWFQDLSGSDAAGSALFSQFFLSSSRYPKGINLAQSALDPRDVFNIGTGAIFSNSAGVSNFIWGANANVAPWSQLRQGQTHAGTYFNQNLIYNIVPQSSLSGFGSGKEIISSSYNEENRVGDNVLYNFYRRYKETPITSKYKPLINRMKVYPGTPSETADFTIDVAAKYSYGNFLQGFANKELNTLINPQSTVKHYSHIYKRPYEIFRNNFVENLPPSVTGIEMHQQMQYSETIYPREIYTYLSESRARQAFYNSFWKEDQAVSSTDLSSFTTYSQLTNPENISTYNRQVSRLKTPFVTSQGYLMIGTDNTPYNSLLYTATATIVVTDSGGVVNGETFKLVDSVGLSTQYTINGGTAPAAGGGNGGSATVGFSGVGGGAAGKIAAANAIAIAINATTDANYTAFSDGVATVTVTQGTMGTDGNRTNTDSISGVTVGNFTGGAAFTIGNGSGSIWSLDSYLYSDSIESLKTVLTGGAAVLLADASTMAAGELMMLNYGSVNDGITDPASTNASASWQRNSSVTSQYVYNVPSVATGSESVTIPATSATATITAVETTPSVLNGLTFIITTTTTAVTFTFDQTKLPSASVKVTDTAYTVGVSGLSSTNGVINAVYTGVSLAKSDGNIDVTPTDPGAVGAVMTITADVAGTAINGNAITGTGVSGGQLTQAAFAGGTAANTTIHVSYDLPDPLQPGGAYTRPAWTAGSERRFVDGASKGALAPQQYPFYNTYDDYVQAARLVGQEYTIVPEFRISELLHTYQTQGNVLSLVQKSLSITGSNHDNYDASVNSDFIPRYATSDLLEYLDPFMELGTLDYDYNKYPRQFGIKSDAILKLLPYDGFYPNDRSLQIATMFSQSYAPASAAQWAGASGSSSQRWRTLHRPFFAPGILYNSIKSGLSVEYPVWTKGRNTGSFMEASAYTPLAGALSGTLLGNTAVAGQIPGNRRRRTEDGNTDFNFNDIGVNKFFWSKKLPFEAILKPLEFISDTSNSGSGLQLSDINPYLKNEVIGSVSTTGSIDDLLYRLSISNFLGSVPQFFLKEKENNTYMTKFVAEIPQTSKASPEGSAPVNNNSPRTIRVEPKTAYVMEIGLKKTDKFNLYNNPYAFGIPTSTGSVDWQVLDAASGGSIATRTQVGNIPQGQAWPLHRGEFAPFTPPYYYGPSLVRIIYMPRTSKDVSLREILYGDEIYTEFVNENGQYYDFSSGSFVLENGNTIETSDYPPYQWNRAWKNRMDIDASVVIDNIFSTEAGNISPLDQNRWVVMPKWECPVLDFSGSGGSYNFSSSIGPTEYSTETRGMWHQYGVEPNTNEGVYMYISDVGINDLEYRLVGDSDGSNYPSATMNPTSLVQKVKKIPKYVFDQGIAEVKSLANLVGFPEDQVMPAGQWVPERAKRIGQLADNNEKTISEAIIAMPFWLDGKTNQYNCMTMTADSSMLGPRIKEFRRAFTKYSLPPALKKSLTSMIPPDFPDVSQLILPFGEDDYDVSFAGESILKTPIVYLFEHTTAFTKQDLADIWQGIMPDKTKILEKNVTSLDHYMPGELVEPDPTVFPEVLQKQLDLGVNPTGHPRVDLIDVTGELNGFNKKIKWLVFKVKQRGPTSYYETIFNEINTGPGSMSFQNLFGYLSPDLPSALREALERQKNIYTEYHYATDQVGQGRNTFNWPYDYCSLIELNKLTATTGFRPELEKEVAEYRGENPTPDLSLPDSRLGNINTQGLAAMTPSTTQPSILRDNFASPPLYNSELLSLRPITE